MGQSTSIIQNSSQNISNSITQISQANCVNACIVGNNKTDIELINTIDNGGLNSTQACFISGASRVLKSSLDSSLINSQASTQKGSILDKQNIFDLFNELATIGSSDDINQSNYQSISNDVTQIINSTCQNPSEVTNNSLTLLSENSVINGGINLTQKGSNTNSQCIINNMTKNYVSNSQTNSQSASIKKGACIGSLGGIVGILILILAFKLLTHDSKKQKPKTPTKQTPTKQTPTKQTPTKQTPTKQTPTKQTPTLQQSAV